MEVASRPSEARSCHWPSDPRGRPPARMASARRRSEGAGRGPLRPPSGQGVWPRGLTVSVPCGVLLPRRAPLYRGLRAQGSNRRGHGGQGAELQTKESLQGKQVVRVVRCNWRVTFSAVRHSGSTLVRTAPWSPGGFSEAGRWVRVGGAPRLTLPGHLCVVSGEEDSTASRGDTVDGPSPEDEAPQRRGPEAQAAPRPCPGERGRGGGLAAAVTDQAAIRRAAGQRPRPGGPFPSRSQPGRQEPRGSAHKPGFTPARHHAGNGIGPVQPLLPASGEPASSELDTSPRPVCVGRTGQSSSSGTNWRAGALRGPPGARRLHTLLQDPVSGRSHQARPGDL